jgi:8-oxo-dGTP diphosphatase
LRQRPSARLLVISPQGKLLLFHFVHDSGALAGKSFWATPGGGLEPGESFADAARREYLEEVGIEPFTVGPEIAQRQFEMPMPDGEIVLADERYFPVYCEAAEPQRAGWTAQERHVMRAHRWWTQDALIASAETVFPEEVAALWRRAMLATR